MIHISIRCPARARLLHGSNKVEIKNLNHNHAAIVPRRAGGEAKKLKKALLTERKLEKQTRKCSSD